MSPKEATASFIRLATLLLILSSNWIYGFLRRPERIEALGKFHGQINAIDDIATMSHSTDHSDKARTDEESIDHAEKLKEIQDRHIGQKGTIGTSMWFYSVKNSVN